MIDPDYKNSLQSMLFYHITVSESFSKIFWKSRLASSLLDILFLAVIFRCLAMFKQRTTRPRISPT